jgi:hypothetical protein
MPPRRMVPALEVPGTTTCDLSHPRTLEACVYRPETNHVQDERHSYEKCQYEEFKLRVKKMDELKAQNPGHRSN